MKKFFIGLFIFFITGVFVYSQQALTLNEAIAQAADRIERDIGSNKKIAVLNFISSSQNLSTYVIDELMDIFTNHRVLEVTERSRMDAILRERNFQTSGEVSDAEIQSIGNQLGASYIITGQLDYSGIAYRFRVYAIDIARGTRVASTSADIGGNDRQLAYFLGGNQGGSSGPVVNRLNKEFQFSLGGGAFGNFWFYKHVNRYGDKGEYTSGDYGINGGLSAEFFSYVLFDAALNYKYMYISSHEGYGLGMSGPGISFALYGKYPFQINQKTTLYPLVGLGYDMTISSKDDDGGSERGRDWWKDRDSLYLRIGGGLNYDFSEHLRFNVKLLYNFHLYSEYASNYGEYSKHGPGLSLGLSYVF
jgi:TolB-like protein